MKVKFFNKSLIVRSSALLFLLIGIISSVLSYFEIHWGWRTSVLVLIVICMIAFHTISWKIANKLTAIQIKINNSNLIIEFGDIFDEDAKKVIPVNEYFDTTLENGVISDKTLHGKYLKTLESTKTLDKEISELDQDKIVDTKVSRKYGKKVRYDLGTILERKKYLLLAFSHFDKDNRANLTMNEYVRCLLNMWIEIDKIYNGETVCLPLLGSGMTRMLDNTEITDQELLEIMIWTYRISKVKFTYPSKVKFIVYTEKTDKINLYKIMTDNNSKIIRTKKEE